MCRAEVLRDGWTLAAAAQLRPELVALSTYQTNLLKLDEWNHAETR